MIEAAIFDMDGVIVDSEPLWRQAEFMIFRSVGIELNEKMASRTKGLNAPETIRYWYSYRPWKGKDFDQVEQELISEVNKLIRKIAGPVEGSIETIEKLAKKGLKIGLASGSPQVVIDTVMDKFKLKNVFHAVQTCDNEQYSKPHPGVYLSVAGKLKKDSIQCLAFEDSFYGALAAKSAQMKVVALLENGAYENTKFDFADLKIRSFSEFNDEQFNKLDNHY